MLVFGEFVTVKVEETILLPLLVADSSAYAKQSIPAEVGPSGRIARHSA